METVEQLYLFAPVHQVFLSPKPVITTIPCNHFVMSRSIFVKQASSKLGGKGVIAAAEGRFNEGSARVTVVALTYEMISQSDTQLAEERDQKVIHQTQNGFSIKIRSVSFYYLAAKVQQSVGQIHIIFAIPSNKNVKGSRLSNGQKWWGGSQHTDFSQCWSA